MRRFIILIAASAFLGFSAKGQDKKAEPAAKESLKKISTGEASKHFGETMIVTGSVAQVSIREKLVYLNLDKKYPDSPFTCVIFARATNDFGNLKALEGKRVEASGKIEDYHDKPQIVLTNAAQLKVIEQSSAPATSGKQ